MKLFFMYIVVCQILAPWDSRDKVTKSDFIEWNKLQNLNLRLERAGDLKSSSSNQLGPIQKI